MRHQRETTMNISKTTTNYAAKRGLELTISEGADKDLVCIWEADNDCEWLCSYRINSDSLSFNGNIYLPQAVKEELPGTIFSEKQLRTVLDFISKELAA